MPDAAKVPLTIAAQYIGSEDQPVNRETLRRWGQRMGALEIDDQYRQSLDQSLVHKLRDHFRAHGRLSPPGVRTVAEFLELMEAAE